MPEQDEPSAARLEAKKREVLIKAIDETLPMLAREDRDAAREFARQTLEDIREGNNPDLEPKFRQKLQELGIEIQGL